jgi:type I restriction-modification system DNA methylase subunit
VGHFRWIDRRDGVGDTGRVREQGRVVWKIADKLRGHLKPHEYGSVMLPTLVLFRLDAVLEPTKPAVLARMQGLDLNSPAADALLKRPAGGLPFYNTCPLSMKTMLSDDKNIAAQLQSYVAGFSPAAADVLGAFGYQQRIARLDKAGVLYAVLGDFADIELHPDVVSNEAMGYVFEELLRKSAADQRVGTAHPPAHRGPGRGGEPVADLGHRRGGCRAAGWWNR